MTSQTHKAEFFYRQISRNSRSMLVARCAILYSLNGQLLFVATDRISAFDYVLATGIPEKGRVLTQLSLFWFDFLKRRRQEPSGHGQSGPVS